MWFLLRVSYKLFGVDDICVWFRQPNYNHAHALLLPEDDQLVLLGWQQKDIKMF
jgi:hypothetical protein